MSNAQIQSGFVTPDGKVFKTRKEADDHLRIPAIKEALAGITDSAELVDWLISVRDELSDAFGSSKVRRVVQKDRTQLQKALQAVSEEMSENSDVKFLLDNANAIVNSFRWPTVPRDEESQAALLNDAVASVVAGEDDEEVDADMVAWLIANREGLLAAFEAGKVKREVSQAAIDGLAAYRKRQAEAKAAAEAEANNE